MNGILIIKSPGADLCKFRKGDGVLVIVLLGCWLWELDVYYFILFYRSQLISVNIGAFRKNLINNNIACAIQMQRGFKI